MVCMKKEGYAGVKFRCELDEEDISEDNSIIVRELVGIGNEVGKRLDVKGSEGNLSARVENGFVIKAAGSRMGELEDDDFTLVYGADEERFSIFAKGTKEPSSESFMHYLIYERRKDVGGIIHVHHKGLLEHANGVGIPKTRKALPYGTKELAEQVVKALEKGNGVAMKGHGIVVVGGSVSEARNHLFKFLSSLPPC